MDRVCMYCCRVYGSAPGGPGPTHGICSGCGELSQDVRDAIARVHRALAAVGARFLPGDLVVAAPFALLSARGLSRVLTTGAELEGLELVRASFRWAAEQPAYAREVALRSGRELLPLVAALEAAVPPLEVPAWLGR